MKELILILLFSEWIQLTPAPVNIEQSLLIIPDEALSAITAGAALHIDLKSVAPGIGIKIGIREALQILERRIPPGQVRAYLGTSAGSQVILDRAYFSLEDDKSWLVVTSSTGVPTGIEFTRIIIESDVDIPDVLIYWKNCSK